MGWVWGGGGGRRRGTLASAKCKHQLFKRDLMFVCAQLQRELVRSQKEVEHLKDKITSLEAVSTIPWDAGPVLLNG